jgi:tetratricopeptide (TPR) repeat protein
MSAEDQARARWLRFQGERHLGAGRWSEALDAYREARDLFATDGSPLQVAECDFGMGGALGELGRYQEALEAHRSAREVFEDLGDRHSVANCDHGAGIALRGLGRLHEALDAHGSVREVFEDLGDRPSVANCDHGAGIALRGLGRHHEALEAYRSAREVYEDLGDRHSVANCDHGAGNALVDLGRHHEALDAYRSAREVYEDLGDRRRVANCDHGAGNALRGLGRHHEALEAYGSARAVYEDLGDRHSVALCYYSAGDAFRGLGRFQESLDAYRQVLPVLEESANEEVLSECQEQVQVSLPTLLADNERRLAEAEEAAQTCAREGRWMEAAAAQVESARCLKGLGRPEEARRLLTAAYPIYDRAGLAFESAICHAELGLAYDALGRRGEAATSYRTAATTYVNLEADGGLQIGAWGAAKAAAEAAEQRLEAAQAGRALAESLSRASRDREAIDAYRHAARGLARLGQPLEAARCRVGQGSALAHLDRHGEALSVLFGAREELVRADQVLEVAQCDRILGQLRTTLGEYSEAQADLLRARSVLEKAKRSEEVADCDLALAWVHLSQDKPQDALGCAEAARNAYSQELALAACELVRARALVSLGRPDEAFDAAYEARGSFVAAHLGLRAALAEEVLVEAHLGLAEQASSQTEAERQRRAALNGALRAVGVVDAHRYQLEDPSLRRSWTNAAHPATYARAFSLAHDQHDCSRVAQLVESARIQGLPVRRDSSSIWTALGPKAGARPESGAEPSSADDEASTRADALAQAREPVPLAAPAAVVLAGTPPLAEEATRRRVALEHVLAQSGGNDAWWWGTWVAGETCYWSVIGPPDTGVVEADAIAMADLEPLLARLDQALPQRLGRETDDGALARALGGVMAQRSAEAALASELGSVLLPEPLRRRLLDASEDHPLSLVVAPAPRLGRVPFALLGLDDSDEPVRLGERTVVRLGVSAALLGAVSTRERSRSGGAVGGKARVLSVVDPGGQGLFGAGGPPGAWGQVLTRPQNTPGLIDAGFSAEVATKAAMAQHLSRGFDVMVFLGHAQPGHPNFPADAHLVLWDQVVSARDWLQAPERWPLPPRVGLVACGSGGAEAPEWLGLAPAALSAGARVVMATAWNLPNHKPGHTWALADQVVRVLRDAADPAASWRGCFLDHLRRWRRGQDYALSPLLWGAVQVVGLVS